MICTQINHITMEVDDDDDDLDWITSNAITTCNVERSFFNDWFTGHLNFQIEHQSVLLDFYFTSDSNHNSIKTDYS